MLTDNLFAAVDCRAYRRTRPVGDADGLIAAAVDRRADRRPAIGDNLLAAADRGARRHPPDNLLTAALDDRARRCPVEMTDNLLAAVDCRADRRTGPVAEADALKAAAVDRRVRRPSRSTDLADVLNTPVQDRGVRRRPDPVPPVAEYGRSRRRPGPAAQAVILNAAGADCRTDRRPATAVRADELLPAVVDGRNRRAPCSVGADVLNTSADGRARRDTGPAAEADVLSA